MLVALLVSTAHAAALPLPAGKASVSDTVEVPLYAGLDPEDPYWYVEVKVGETPLLLRVSTGFERIRLTDAGVKKAGAKAGGKDKTAKLKSLALGGATFSDVTVYDRALDDAAFTLGVDGELGLGAFPDLSWAILPSQGVLRVGPKEKGAGWVSDLGGGMAYTSSPNDEVKIGKDKYKRVDAPYIVSLSWDGVAVPTELVSQSDDVVLPREATDANRWWSVDKMDLPVYTLPAAAGFHTPAYDYESRKVQVGSDAWTALVHRIGYGLQYATHADAELGMDVLGSYDLAIDAAGKKLALERSAGSKLQDYGTIYEAALRKKLEPAAGKDGAAPDPDAAKDAKKGGLPKLVSYLLTVGRASEAVSSAQELSQLEPEQCSAWQTLGDAQLAAGQAQDAATSYTKASDLYGPWAARTLDERTELQSEYDAAQKKKAPVDVVPQDSSCFHAWGRLARAKVAAGQPEAVAALYPAKLDLDQELPLAAGIADLVSGDAAGAEAAFRQALHVSPLEEGAAREGLFLAIKNRMLADEQIAARLQVGADPVLLSAYAEAVRKLDGGAKAVDALRALADKNTASPAIQLELGRQYLRDGNADAAKTALAAARAGLTLANAASSRSVALRAQWALLLSAEGDNAGAAAAADALTKGHAGSPVGYWVGAQVATAAGDTAKAGELTRKAAILGVDDPLFAVALAK